MKPYRVHDRICARTEFVAGHSEKGSFKESRKEKRYVGLAPVLIFAALSVMVSCVKDPSTYPTDMLLKFSLENSTKSPHHVVIDSGEIFLESFEFDGIRETGKDYYFKSHFDPPLKADLVKETIKPQTKFAVPQGVYTRIRVKLEMYDDETSPGLFFIGTANFPGRGEIPFEINIGSDFSFEGIGSDAGGSNILSLSTDRISTLEIVFRPGKWFQQVPGHLVDQAHKPEINGIPTLVINKEVNRDIYDIIMFRMQQTTRTVLRH